ncbi:phoenix isoform X2 [Siphateles boraxobius]|uniref:phoenix isoform X2 n=1 Tax=Siphateles boraxobius TaxID=180520 RepID=UPI004063DB77
MHFVRALLCKLKPQCLLPASLAAGLLQSLEGFSEPAFSEIWLPLLIACFFCLVKDKNIFVICYSKEKKKWLPQSILEKRTQDLLSKDKEEQLLNVGGKKKRKTKSTKTNKTTASVKKQSKKKRKVPQSKAVPRTLSESFGVSLSVEQEKRHETHEVLASCSDAEDADSSKCIQPPNKQIIQCAENSHGNNLVVIEERQRHSVEAVSQMEQEDDTRTRTDNHLSNKSNFIFSPQGGDISVQNEIQQSDSDIGSVDLFMPLKKHKNNQIHKTPSIKANMEDSDQDSDVTQIETEGQFESIFGPGTPRWCDGEHHAHEDGESDITQIETKGESVFVFGTRKPTKRFTIQDVNSTKHTESQMTGQSPVVLHTELLSRREDKTRHKNKRRKSMSCSHKETEVTGIKTVTVQASSKHLPLADEPLREVYSSEHVIVGKQRTVVEMETDTTDSPLFKNVGMSFLKRKRKGKKKMGATILIECDTNVDVSQKVSSVDYVTELKTTCRENRELCDVENGVTNEEQTAASILESEETSKLLDEIILSTVADSNVIKKAMRKKRKMDKLKEREHVQPGVGNQFVEAVQFTEPQTTELTLKRTKKKRKDKERTKTAYVEGNSATDIPLNETLDFDRPAELTINEGNQSSAAHETGHPKHMQTSEEITGCPSLNVTRLKSVKKKKKKRDETEESQYESADLDVSSMSQFDAGLRVFEQQEDQVNEERQSNDSAAEHLEGNTANILKVAERKKKSQNLSSPQIDDIIGLEKQVSGMQPESTAEPINLGSDDTYTVITKDKQKRAKKQKLKEPKTIELAADINDIVQFQYSESQSTDLPSRRTKKRANKDRERTTVGSSNELLEHIDDRSPQKRGNNVIQSNEATETDRIEHLQSSEGNTRCPSPSVTRLSSGKKKKKKRDRSEERLYESVDLNLDACSVSQFVVAGLRAQKIIERQSNAAEHLECYGAHVLNVAKHKKKSKNASSQSEVDLIGLENAVLDSQSGNTAELKRNKKKKHKLKEQVDTDTNAVTHSMDNVHSVETDQFIESQTTELTLKRKKKRKDKEKKTAYVEENSATDTLSIQIFEATETNHHENLQTSEQIERCLSPSVTRLKSVREKKNDGEECQYESVDFALDVSLGSRVDNVTDRSTTQQSIEERPSDVEHLESNTEAKLNGTKRKKKRKRSTFSINFISDFSSSSAQMQETVTPERKMKKKRL